MKTKALSIEGAFALSAFISLVRRARVAQAKSKSQVEVSSVSTDCFGFMPVGPYNNWMISNIERRLKSKLPVVILEKPKLHLEGTTTLRKRTEYVNELSEFNKGVKRAKFPLRVCYFNLLLVGLVNYIAKHKVLPSIRWVKDYLRISSTTKYAESRYTLFIKGITSGDPDTRVELPVTVTDNSTPGDAITVKDTSVIGLLWNFCGVLAG